MYPLGWSLKNNCCVFLFANNEHLYLHNERVCLLGGGHIDLTETFGSAVAT